ncbi:MAG: ATP-binding cassette domain-containing protein [Hydrotalea sp. AMD]|uniref:peptidase domain-containing ABC transporter n=1 Tax=Hydrotalea sp. AMD TaxID=2501297 RepID=UPI0009455976|nr:cysteine peptidase family C39 domain-containing protein [Hydrotalea sp. AMD]RTL48682.1 MAG: ATP-binding cassette domain-containing protein [Sphingobacteriales bacterium]RWZ88130.1 MAG: ATP-binding cassette domain-containing protein [Hydrotalea sp. AMD]
MRVDNFLQQSNQFDCGPVCLYNILLYHNTQVSLEEVREKCGTTSKGTNLLAMHDAAISFGLTAEGAEASEVENLYTINLPCILHVIIQDKLLHFVILCEIEGKETGTVKFKVFDPAKGISILSKEDLLKIWPNKRLLLIQGKKQDYTSTHFLPEKKEYLNLWQLLKEYRSISLLTSFLGIVIATLGLSIAIFTQSLVENILPSKNERLLLLSTSFFLFVLIFKVLISLLKNYLHIKISKQVNSKISSTVFEKVVNQKKFFYDSRQIGDVLLYLKDISIIENSLIALLSEPIINLFIVIISMLFLFFQNIYLGISSMVGLTLMIILGISIRKFIVSSNKSLLMLYGNLESEYLSIIENIASVKIFLKNHIFSNSLKNIFSLYNNKTNEINKTKVKFQLLIELISTLSIFIIFLIGSYTIFINENLPTQLISISQISYIFIQASISLSLSFITFYEFKVSKNRLDSFFELNVEPHVDSIYPDEVQLISLSNINFKFPGSDSLFTNFSFTSEVGKFTVLQGDNGTGKSTLLQLLGGLYMPASGTIRINGDIDFFELKQKNTYVKIGYMPQEIRLFDATIIENILFERFLIDDVDIKNDFQEKTNLVMKLLQSYNLDKYFDTFPNGLLTVIGEGGINVSGGQKQMIGFTRAIINKPSIILLDEPISSMDELSASLLCDAIKIIKAHSIVIAAIHNGSLLALADKIVTLQKPELFF